MHFCNENLGKGRGFKPCKPIVMNGFVNLIKLGRIKYFFKWSPIGIWHIGISSAVFAAGPGSNPGESNLFWLSFDF